MPKDINRKEIVKIAKELATPIDFDELEVKGILTKHGAWYKISNKKLPPHVSRQIRAVKEDNEGNHFVQLPKTWKRAQQLYRKLTGKEYNE